MMIILSALLYLIPHLYPHTTYMSLFIWMIPLLIGDKDNTYGFKQGFTWGLILYTGHLYWLAYSMRMQGYLCIGLIAYVLFILYLSVVAGIWFWVKKKILNRYLAITLRIQQDHNVALCFTWLFSAVAFIFISCSLSFAIFDCFEGYYLSNPLLTLVSLRWFIGPIVYCGETLYWFIVISINIMLYRILIKYDTAALIFLMALLLLLWVFQPQPHNIFITTDDIVYLQPSWNHEKLTAAQTFYTISRELDALAITNPNAKYVVMPESSFAHNLIDWADKLDAWTSLFSSTTSIFIGAHRKQGDYIYNSLFEIQDGKIVVWYDKQHLVFFTERIPSLCKHWSLLRGLFGSCEFNYPVNNQSHQLAGGFQPAICSEIFCGARTFQSGKPILFICHDAWLGCDYIAELGKNAAVLTGIKYGVPVVYVGSYTSHVVV